MDIRQLLHIEDLSEAPRFRTACRMPVEGLFVAADVGLWRAGKTVREPCPVCTVYAERGEPLRKEKTT